jgi:hypothetical protein
LTARLPENIEDWPEGLANYGDGLVGGILSVDISDWETPGILYGKEAMQCTALRSRTTLGCKRHIRAPIDTEDIVITPSKVRLS